MPLINFKYYFKIVIKRKSLIIIIYLIMLILLLYTLLGMISTNINSSQIVFKSAEINNDFNIIRTKIYTFKILSVILFITIFFIWVLLIKPIFYLSFIITGLIYNLFYKVDRNLVNKERKYILFIKKKYYPTIQIISIITIFGGIILFAQLGGFHLPKKQLMNIFILFSMIFMFIIHSITWIILLNIRKKRQNKQTLNKVLFSKSLVKSEYVDLLSFMLFLAVFLRFLCPFLLDCSIYFGEKYQTIMEKKYDYASKWESFQKSVLLKGSRTELVNILPRFPNIKSEFTPLLSFKLKKMYLGNRSFVLNRCFLFIVFCGFLAIGYPTIAGSFIFKGRRKALMKIALATMKTIIITFVLQFFILKAFMVDMSEPLGVGVLFLFLLTFFMTFESNK